MANIYSISCPTIAAPTASDNHTGLFLDRWTSAEGQNGVKLPIKAHRLPGTDQLSDESIFVRPRLYPAHERFIQY